jgi:hypothetical protein
LNAGATGSGEPVGEGDDVADGGDDVAVDEGNDVALGEAEDVAQAFATVAIDRTATSPFRDHQNTRRR